MAKLRHPNVIGFVEAFVEHKMLHIVMEYADQMDLEKQLNECIKAKVESEHSLS